MINFTTDEEGNTNFICPLCNHNCQTIRAYNGTYSTHTNFKSECILQNFYTNSDYKWKLKLAAYKERLQLFFYTDEYKITIKQEILKSL